MTMYGQKYAGQPRPPSVTNMPTGSLPVTSTGLTASAPIVALTHTQKSITLHRQGKLQEAADGYRAVLTGNPDQIECLHYYGMLLHQTGYHQEALPLILRAISLQPSDPTMYSNLSLVHLALREYQQALDCCDRALALNQNSPDALNNRGNVLRDLKRLDEALLSYAAAVEARPDFLAAHANSGLVHQTLGHHGEALRCFEQAIALAPTAFLHNARGCMLHELFRLEEAIYSFEQAISLQGDFLEAWINLGGTHFILGQTHKANEAFERGLGIAPQSAELRLKRLIMRVPIILSVDDDVSAIRSAFAHDIAEFANWVAKHDIENPLEVVGCIQPFYLAYHEHCNRNLLAPYGAVCAHLMKQWSERHHLASLPVRRVAPATIRIGIVSAHFIDHPVWNAIVKGWFQELDPARFELHAFHLGATEDAQTVLARRRAKTFHAGPKSDAEWADLIVAAGVDVLIYPELGMNNLTPRLAAMRLAHVQIATWGHPETTSLPTIDAYLSSDGFEAIGAHEHYVEKLFLLPDLGCYYEPEQVTKVDVALADIGIREGAPLFVCPGSPYKYTPEHDHVFVDIARRLPESQFIFFKIEQLQAVGEQFHQRVTAAFRSAGIDPSHHMAVLPWQSKPQFHSIMRQADVYLDTIGFSGFNTAMQAVECDLPIVTVEGRFMRGRFASAILKLLGLPELACINDDDYVEMAIALAEDSTFSTEIREKLRANRNRLYKNTASIRALENVLRELCGAPSDCRPPASRWSWLKRLTS